MNFKIIFKISIFTCICLMAFTNQAIAQYDSTKAKAYGADDYGMRTYIMAFLYAGPNRSEDPKIAAELQNAHLKNITRLAKEGKLSLAGPFYGNDDALRGIYIFNVETIEEAEALTNSDPAIKAGSLRMELKKWYGSAALLEVNQIHETLTKKVLLNNEFESNYGSSFRC